MVWEGYCSRDSKLFMLLARLVKERREAGRWPEDDDGVDEVYFSREVGVLQHGAEKEALSSHFHTKESSAGL